jgi:hypothetical protein
MRRLAGLWWRHSNQPAHREEADRSPPSGAPVPDKAKDREWSSLRVRPHLHEVPLLHAVVSAPLELFFSCKLTVIAQRKLQ